MTLEITSGSSSSDSRFVLQSSGFAVVLSAPSGGGKTTICKRLLDLIPGASYSVSVTTRRQRPGEVDGRDYQFVDREEFQRRIEAGYFVEWAEVHGNLYGTDRRLIAERIGAGEIVLADLDVQGGNQLKRALSETVLVFVLPPSWQVLEARLRARGDESEEAVRLRLQNARQEMRAIPTYDYWVLNDDLDVAVQRVAEIVRSEGRRSHRLRVRGWHQNPIPSK
jgi:guanylate kinase